MINQDYANTSTIAVDFDESVLEYSQNQENVQVSLDNGITWVDAFINGYSEGNYMSFTRSDWRNVWNVTAGDPVMVRTFEGGEPKPWFEAEDNLRGGIVTGKQIGRAHV